MALISCPECATNVSDKAASCPSCGYPIAKPKSRGVYIILGLLFGGAGLHNFYSGHNVVGTIKITIFLYSLALDALTGFNTGWSLVVLVIFAFWSLIEVISVKTDARGNAMLSRWIKVMPVAARIDRHRLAGWVCVPFILLHLFDGYWKVGLLRGPLIYYWVYDFAKWLLLPVVLLTVLHRLTFVRAREYGLSADPGMRDVFVLPIAFATLFIVYVVALGLAQLFFPSSPPFNHAIILAPLGSLWVAGTFYLSATAGLWESVFLIGLPWLWFNKGTTVSPSAVSAFTLGVGLLFAAGHWENGVASVVGAFVFQIVAVWWYLWLRTLWPIVGAHFLIDLISFAPADI